jgi:uncharacterized membrane protein YccC
MSDFQTIMVNYLNLPSKSDTELSNEIRDLDSALKEYRADPTNSLKRSAVTTILTRITDYYVQIRDLTRQLRRYLNTSAKKISNAHDTLVNEVRYDNRVHPEESIVSREIAYGIFPRFRERSLPYILAIGVFMALVTIFLVLHALGFRGQMTLPQTIVNLFISPAGSVSIPFYKNPMVLGGLSAILGSALIIFIILYFNKKS